MLKSATLSRSVLLRLLQCFGAVLGLTCIVAPNYGQQPPAPPSAGQILKDIEEKPQPIRPTPPPRIEVAPDKRRAIKPPPSLKVDVKAFRFSGLTSVREESLQAVVQKFIGPDKTYDDLQAAVEAVSEYLQQQGYFVAQAFLPEQKIENGVVEIAVLEGRLGDIKLEIDQGVPVSRSTIEGLLSSMPSGTVLHRDTVERVLFLLSDLRGMAVRSIVEPGPTPGTANLVVKISARKRVDGSIELDKQGSRYTGEYRVGGSMDINSPFGRGDLLSFRGLVSIPGGGRSLEFGRLSYLSPVGNYGTRLGTAYSRLNYHLGTATFEALDQGGRADVISLFGLHPVIRTRNLNVFAQAAFDLRDFKDEFQGRGFVIDKKSKVATLGVLGDTRDPYLGGGINNFSLTYTAGKLDSDFNLPAGQLVTDVGQGHFSRLNGSVARLNALAESTVLYVSYAFQLASKNLDASEKISLGGPSGVRAYPLGEGSADEAQLFTAEVRYGIPSKTFVPGNVVVSAFFDIGRAKLNRDLLPGQTVDNTRTISGAGLGLTWGRQDDFLFRGSLAWRLTGRPTSDPVDRKPRLYFQAVKYF